MRRNKLPKFVALEHRQVNAGPPERMGHCCLVAWLKINQLNRLAESG